MAPRLLLSLGRRLSRPPSLPFSSLSLQQIATFASSSTVSPSRKRGRDAAGKVEKERIAPRGRREERKPELRRDDGKGAFTLFSDGSASPNPGHGGLGFLLINEKGDVVRARAEYAGEQISNNEAEYRALILGMREALEAGANRLQVYLDSQLVCRQVKREYEVKAPNMASLLKEAMALQGRFQYFSISYIDRGRNQVANDLANAGRKGGKSRQGTEEAVASIVKRVKTEVQTSEQAI